MDEATSMLDPQGRDEVIRIVHELKRSTGLTVISITHDLEEALLADRVFVMNQGKVMQTGNRRKYLNMEKNLNQLDLTCHLLCGFRHFFVKMD